MEYRVDFLFSFFGALIPIVIQYFLWTAIFEHSGQSVVYGYTYVQIITYTILAGIISKLIVSGVEFEIAEDIKNGKLNKFIVQPIGYLPYRIFMYLGNKFIYVFITLAILLFILTILNSYFALNIQWERIMLFFPILCLSIILNFLVYYSISAIAFWLVEIWHFFYATSFVVTILSGGVFPLDIFGETVVKISNFLPFKYIIFFPTNVLNGKLPLNEVMDGLWMQVIWVMIMFVVSKIIWSFGYKKYTAVGG